MDDLEKNIALQRQILNVMPPHDPERWKIFGELSFNLDARYQRDSRLSNLQEIITLYREVLETVPENSPNKPRLLYELGTYLSTRHQHTNQGTDLEEAIGCQRNALECASTDPRITALILNHLGNCLRRRFECTGRMADLTEAIACLRRARAMTPVDSPDLWKILHYLSAALRNRYESTEQLEDLQEAIAIIRYTLDLVGPDFSGLHAVLNGLGNCLFTRFERTRQLEDLQGAIAAYRRVLDGLRPGSPERPQFLRALGAFFERQYEITDRIEDLAEANVLNREADQLQQGLHVDAGLGRQYMESINVTCTQCGPVPVKYYAIVDLADVEQHPQLATAIRDDTIHDLICPQCNTKLGRVVAPLLLHCPGSEPTLVFSPAQGTTSEQDPGAVQYLVQKWLALSDYPATNPKPRAVTIPRHFLAVVVDEGVHIAEARFAEALPKQVDPVENMVESLMQPRRWWELYVFLREHEHFRSEEVEEALLKILERARTNGQEKRARPHEEIGELLGRCREIGFEEAFIEKLGCTLADLRELDAMSQLPRSIRKDVDEAEQHRQHYLRFENIDAMDAAIACWERVLSDPLLSFLPLLQKIELLNDAGKWSLEKYRTLGEPSCLNQAMEYWTRALDILPVGVSLRCTFLQNLGLGQWARYQRVANPEDLDEAIMLWRQVANAAGRDSWMRLQDLTMLEGALIARYKRARQMVDLEEVILVGQKALFIDLTDDQTRAKLAMALTWRFEREGDVADLDASIAICRGAPSPGATILDTLGNVLAARYEWSGKAEDLEDAITAYRKALNAAATEGSERRTTMANLGGALHYRYVRAGRIQDLDEAIRMLRAAAADDPSHLPSLANLSYALNAQYERTGRMTDLQESIDIMRRVVDASVPGSMNHGEFLNGLGYMLFTRYQRTRNVTDLQETIALWRQTLEAAPAGAPHQRTILSNLGSALLERYKLMGRLDDLQEAVHFDRRAVDCVAVGEPHPPNSLHGLGNSLHKLYLHTRSLNDLNEAIAAQRSAAKALDPDSPKKPAYLNNLALSLYDRHQHMQIVEDLEEALALINEACELGRKVNPEVVLRATNTRGQWAIQRSDWKEAANAYHDVMAMMDTLCETQLLSSEKRSWLRHSHHLYPMAAYCLARTGNVEDALIAMETGRARGLAEMLDLSRANLEDVETYVPELVHRYRQAFEEIRELEARAKSSEAASIAASSESAKRLPEQIRMAHTNLRATLEAIRNVPGGEVFLTRPSLSALADALEPGIPAIYLAATDVGGIALVASRSESGLEVMPLWLDSFKMARIGQLLGQVEFFGEQIPLQSWLGAYAQWLKDPHDKEACTRWHERITITTRALWDLAMGPVIAMLREHHPKSAQAVLIPDGYLALLPWHAAWTQDEQGRQRYALDEVVFSYAPSLRALAHARDIANTCGQTKFLVVAEPQPTSATPLPNCSHEVEIATALFPRNDVTMMTGKQCLRDDVLAAIADADVCHFSCHGMTDWREPLQSGLLMTNDEILTVEALLTMNRQQARLAVLSACETGLVGADVPNEVVALPTAFLQAGFAGAVASLWSVYDMSTSLLMARFYELWRLDGLSPAVALRRAQLWLRDLTNRDLLAHLEQLVPELAPRMSLENAEALHFSALLQDPNAAPFAHPVHWAAFYLTGV